MDCNCQIITNQVTPLALAIADIRLPQIRLGFARQDGTKHKMPTASNFQLNEPHLRNYKHNITFQIGNS
jgi:hypothetical protein